MTSLSQLLPSRGSVTWRTGRSPTLDDTDDDARRAALILDLHVRHIALRAVSIRGVPTPHVVYHIDVMTNNDSWVVYRQYREFYALQEKVSVFSYDFPF